MQHQVEISMSETSMPVTSHPPKRPAAVWVLTILDGLLFGVLAILVPVWIFFLDMTSFHMDGSTDPFGLWLMSILRWWQPADHALFRFSGELKIGYLLVILAAFQAWRGRAAGRVLLLGLVSVLSLIQPVAFMLARFENHAYGGHFDESGLKMAARFGVALGLIALNFWYFTRREVNAFYMHDRSALNPVQGRAIRILGLSLFQWLLIVAALALPLQVNMESMRRDIDAADVSRLLQGSYVQPQGTLFEYGGMNDPLSTFKASIVIALVPLAILAWLSIFFADRTLFPVRDRLMVTAIFAIMLGTVFSFVSSTIMPITWIAIFEGLYHNIPSSYKAWAWSDRYVFPAVSLILFFAMNISLLGNQKGNPVY
jgi:hypothetical protein